MESDSESSSCSSNNNEICWECDEEIIMDDDGMCNWFFCEECESYVHSGCIYGWLICNGDDLDSDCCSECKYDKYPDLWECCICGDESVNKLEKNNANPYEKGSCCNDCNIKYVIPCRLEKL